MATYLCKFHLDNDYILERVADAYDKIFGRRKKYRLTSLKRPAALAFAIFNTLAKEKMPRPMPHIAAVCKLDRIGRLNNLPDELNLTQEELRNLEQHDYILADEKIEDFADTLCAYFNISFSTMKLIETEARILSRDFHGRCSMSLLAAAVQRILIDCTKEGCEERLKLDLCETLGCSQEKVNEVICLRRRRLLVQRRKASLAKSKKKKVKKTTVKKGN